MIWTTKRNWALNKRKRIDSASITTTRLSTQRIGSRKEITPMPPATAMAAAAKKIAIANATVAYCLPPWGEGQGGGAEQPLTALRRLAGAAPAAFPWCR